MTAPGPEQLPFYLELSLLTRSLLQRTTIADAYRIGSHLVFQQTGDSVHAAVMAHAWCMSGNPKERPMATRIAGLCAAALIPFLLAVSSVPTRAEDPGRQALENGIVKVRSAYPVDETIKRIKQDVSSKGIMFFLAVDQSKLASDAGIKLRPSTLLIFGNPALGSQFMTSNPIAGIDWPVRLLVVEDEKGEVWAVYNDFAYIAGRHGISDRDTAFQKASEVIASITSSVAK